MKNILIATFVIIFTMNYVVAQDVEGVGNNPYYDFDTRLVHIPVLNLYGEPAFSEIELYFREDGLFELKNIREYDEFTDAIEPEVIYVDKIVYVYPDDCGVPEPVDLRPISDNPDDRGDDRDIPEPVDLRE